MPGPAGQHDDDDVVGLTRGLRAVTFEPRPVIFFRAVHYNNFDSKGVKLRRPLDFSHMKRLLNTALLFDPANEGLTYVPNDSPGAWASNRVRITDEASFRIWMDLEHSYAELPRVVVYPRVDGVSPDKAPPQTPGAPTSGSSVGSASTTHSAREALQAEFCNEIRGLDGRRGLCIVPTCTVFTRKKLSTVGPGGHEHLVVIFVLQFA